MKFVIPRQPDPGQPGAPIYAHSLSVVAPVHSNIAAVQIDREVAIGRFPMIWYGPSGQVVKRIGDLAGANQVTPPAEAVNGGDGVARTTCGAGSGPTWSMPSAGRAGARARIT